MTDNTHDDHPPEGFDLVPQWSPVDASMGRWYLRRDEDGSRTLGFRVSSRHLNINGVCHGGVIATFADVLARVFKDGADGPHGSTATISSMATINLDVDYLAPGLEGAWIHATPEVIKRTGKMLFTQALILDGDTPVARCKAIYRLFNKPGGTD